MEKGGGGGGKVKKLAVQRAFVELFAKQQNNALLLCINMGMPVYTCKFVRLTPINLLQKLLVFTKMSLDSKLWMKNK